MATGQDDERRPEAPDDETTSASPFRRLTPAGEPAWQSPPRPEPVDAFVPTAPTIAMPQEMSTAPEPAPAPATGGSRARYTAVFGLVGGVLLLMAVAAGAYAAYQALLGHDDRATAAYAPANAWAYVAVNVDPTSHAWLDAWTLAKRAGIDDELSQLPKDGLEESGEDPGVWESLIQPALGRELGFAVWPNAAGIDEEPEVAAIVMIADEDKARDALDTLLPGDPRTETTYRDVTYETNDDGDAVGIVDEALILASSSAAFEAVVDAHADGALNGVDDFTAAADRAADSPLVFAYIDGASIADAAASLQDELPAGPDMMSLMTPDFGDAFDVYAELGRITLTVKANDDALQTEVLTEGRPASFPMTPAGNAFADQMPASTLFYVASADLYGTIFAPAIGQYEQMLGTAGADGTFGMPSPDDMTAMLGFDLEGGLLEQLDGPYALSVNVDESNGQYGGQFHFFSEVADPAAVDDTLDDLVETMGIMAPIEPIDDGYRVEIPEEDLTLEVTVVDDTLHLTGSYRATESRATLADDAAFRAAMDNMPDNPTLSGYLATNRIWDLLPADAWDEAGPDARATLEAFGPLAFATAPDGDGTRTVFVMTVK